MDQPQTEITAGKPVGYHEKLEHESQVDSENQMCPTGETKIKKQFGVEAQSKHQVPDATQHQQQGINKHVELVRETSEHAGSQEGLPVDDESLPEISEPEGLPQVRKHTELKRLVCTQDAVKLDADREQVGNEQQAETSVTGDVISEDKDLSRPVSPPAEAIYSDESSDSDSSISSTSSSSSSSSDTETNSEGESEDVESPINREELAAQYSPYYERKVRTGEVYPIEEEEEGSGEESTEKPLVVPMKGKAYMALR